VVGEHVKIDVRPEHSPVRGYMINCAHPTDVERVLEDGQEWTVRIRGLQTPLSRSW